MADLVRTAKEDPGFRAQAKTPPWEKYQHCIACPVQATAQVCKDMDHDFLHHHPFSFIQSTSIRSKVCRTHHTRRACNLIYCSFYLHIQASRKGNRQKTHYTSLVAALLFLFLLFAIVCRFLFFQFLFIFAGGWRCLLCLLHF